MSFLRIVVLQKLHLKELDIRILFITGFVDISYLLQLKDLIALWGNMRLHVNVLFIK